MESTRDIRRMIEREIKKGSAPLTFEHIEYRGDALQEITSESKLKEVLVYLLRTAEFENLANDKGLHEQLLSVYGEIWDASDSSTLRAEISQTLRLPKNDKQERCPMCLLMRSMYA